MIRGYIIAIDGPAASGKSTTAKILARKLGYTYIDTGAMYRAVAFKIIESGIDFQDTDQLDKLLAEIDICFKHINEEQRIFLDNKDVSTRIREQDITKLSSEIAVIGAVRERMVAMQREMGRSGGIVMDGRDIGTVVFPDADFKFFVTASVRTRAIRRWKEIGDNSIALEEIEKDLIWRDQNDSNREIAPLRKAEDAIEVDTTNMSITEQVNYIMKFLEQR
ncbi:MAG: (d)CMP kinase [Candidatus Cloacimonetes bacterium]|nr:(d)CMP kinase [Candidatus Cloacimonadota bacterium]